MAITLVITGLQRRGEAGVNWRFRTTFQKRMW